MTLAFFIGVFNVISGMKNNFKIQGYKYMGLKNSATFRTLQSLLMHNSDCIHGFQGKQFVDFGVSLQER